MTPRVARDILDKRRAGIPVLDSLVTAALMKTGDITPPSPPELATAARVQRMEQRLLVETPTWH